MLKLEQRTGKTELLALSDQEHQILQVQLWKFGPLPLPQPAPLPRGHETLEKAIDFMMKFVEMWKLDKVQDKKKLRELKVQEEKTSRSRSALQSTTV